MYKHGDLKIHDEQDAEFDRTIYDARTPDNEVEVGDVFLPHSCDAWVIGGPAQVKTLIADLQAYLITYGNE